MKLSTKASNLSLIAPLLRSAKVLPQFCCTYMDWIDQKNATLNTFFSQCSWSDQPLIVRSSSINEDSEKQSLAGHFESILNISGRDNLSHAIDTVFNSYGTPALDEIVLIQPMLENTTRSGVVFTRDPSNNAPYYIINYSTSSSTDAVTAGKSNESVCYIAHSYAPTQNTWQDKVHCLCQELESMFSSCALDIEFAFDELGEIYLFQVRPLIIPSKPTMSDSEHTALLQSLANNIERFIKPHPYLNGQRSVLGVMPDWNPAEIIGIRPRPLALSLYKELITDSTWAYQRNNYGYKQLRSFPLLLSLHGLPYIDVRVSFNSFIPKDIPSELAEKLVTFYINELMHAPEKHDKVEFDIIFSCYTLDIQERVTALHNFGFTQSEVNTLVNSLRKLTNNIIKNDGLWRKDINKIKELPARREKIRNGDLSKEETIHWLLEDCKRYGTLPFAGLARAGFIAIQFLRSMVAKEIISNDDYHRYLSSIETVSSNLKSDYKNLSLKGFLKKYGHLRPGTYDILSPRYDTDPSRYFQSNIDEQETDTDTGNFTLSLEQLSALKELLENNGIEHDVISIFSFIKGAIEGREYAKFVFTHSLSDALELVSQVADEYGFSLEDISYSNIGDFLSAYADCDNIQTKLKYSIIAGKKAHQRAQQITLPPLISSEEQVYFFDLPEGEPNFITHNEVTADVVVDPLNSINLDKKIVFIPSADPGYDWLFSHNIAGLVTKYGGCNSHMAIRAGELSIPSVIGAGEVLYNKWAKGITIKLDASNKKVEVLQ